MKRGPSLLEQEIKQRRPFREPAEEATVAILRTADAVRQALATVIQRQGITDQQYNVLRILKGALPDPLPTLEIGQRMIERQPGVTRLLDRLEAKGLVERARCSHDRRVVHCRITEQGLAVLEALDEPVIEADRRLMRELSEADQRRLITLLDQVRAGAQGD
jgi:MarR family transcriptional regulator, organic hydroperoxide resistance regulator